MLVLFPILYLSFRTSEKLQGCQFTGYCPSEGRCCPTSGFQRDRPTEVSRPRFRTSCHAQSTRSTNARKRREGWEKEGSRRASTTPISTTSACKPWPGSEQCGQQIAQNDGLEGGYRPRKH